MFAELMAAIFGFNPLREYRSESNPWRRRRHRARPFQSDRKRGPGPQRMQIEEFADKDARNARFAQLRAAGTRHVNKFSTIRGNQSVWCVVKP